MNAILDRRGSIPGYNRMSSRVRGMLVRPDDSFFKTQVDGAQQANILKDQATSHSYMTDPTVYMVLCLLADLIIWIVAGYVIYRAIKSCRKATNEDTQKLAADKYDRLEADFDTCSLSSTDFDLNEYEDVKPSWIPILFSSDGTSVGKIQKMASNQVKTFHLPFALSRHHSIPNFDKHGANFV